MARQQTLPVKDVMVTNVLTADVNDLIKVVAKKMSERKVGSVLVTKQNKVVGIVTERDLLERVIAKDKPLGRLPISRIMSKPVITISSDTDVMDAADIMKRNKIRRLPVVEDGKLVGLITAGDIMYISSELAEVLARRPELLRETPPKKEPLEKQICESCGKLSEDLYEVNGIWVCDSCRDLMPE